MQRDSPHCSASGVDLHGAQLAGGRQSNHRTPLPHGDCQLLQRFAGKYASDDPPDLATVFDGAHKIADGFDSLDHHVVDREFGHLILYHNH
jgi:hypothetical protein